MNALSITRGDEVFLVPEITNPYDSNAICVINEQKEVLGYIPRYYTKAFVKFVEEGRIEKCIVTNVRKENSCDECIAIHVKITE